MQLSSEQIHWIDGALVVLFSVALIALEMRRHSFNWTKFFVPAGLLILAAGLIFDPLFHGSAVTESFEREIGQHFWLGLILTPAAAIETGLAFGLLRGKFWRMILPLALTLVGAGFFFHAQHQADASAMLLMTQHRIMGATLALAGATKAVNEFVTDENKEFKLVWLFLLLLFGIELLLYTEGNSIFGQSGDQHIM